MRKKTITGKGMSLIEMVMAIAVTAIALQGFSILFFSSWQSNHFVYEEGVASSFAARGVDTVVNALRKARQADNGDFPLEEVTANSIKFYADIDKDGITERVHYFLSNGQLKQGVTKPSVTHPITYAAADTTVTVVADRVVNTGAQPVFEYFNWNYPADTTNNPLANPTASVGEIRLVHIHLYINIDPAHAPDNVNVESFAELRNLSNYE